MREEPPEELVDLLGRLRLANPAQLRDVHGRARRLAIGLPLFSSVWVDALVQARRITPFQAREIIAGRGEQLLVGLYVILEAPRRFGYAASYRARSLEEGRMVDLLIGSRATTEANSTGPQRSFNELVQRLAAVGHPSILPAEQAGEASERQWIAFAPLPTKSLGQRLLQDGRLPPVAVAEIARQMIAAVDKLERGGLVHGDISLSAIGIGPDGTVQLSRTGIRGIWRPDERATADEFPPDMFDTLAPERIASAGGPTAASDLYACGLLWWHLLTGRCPLAGGDVRTKLRAVQSAKIEDVRRFAPDTPDWLREAIARCAERDPRSRPASFADLKSLIGASTPGGRRLLSGHCGGSCERPRRFRSLRRAARSRTSWAPMATVAGSVIAIMAACVAWPSRQPVAAPTSSARAVRDTSLVDTELAPKPLGSEERVPTSGSHVAAGHSREITRQPNGVEAATFLAPVGDEAAMGAPRRSMQSPGHDPATTAPAPWVLPSDKPLICNGGSWSALEAGQTVRGRAGTRPLLLVPPAGMVVATEDVHFENVDFGWLQPPETMASPERLAMVDLRASRATFQGCTFQAEPLSGLGAPVAIRWSGRTLRAGAATSGRLRLNQCVFRGIAASIEWPLVTPAVLQISDTLQLGPGPLVCFQQLPRLDAPAAIVLKHITLRTAAALLELHAERAGDETATVQVKADECAFAPREDGALLLAAGTADPRLTARTIDWSGQGSLLAAGAAVAARVDRGRIEPLAEADVSIDGLVVSRVEFAGSPLAGSNASRLIRWQAPLASADPPGIDAAVPFWPPLRTAAKESPPFDKSNP
jgi:hypothetical protein